jgi:acetyl esterase/lipase
MRVLFFQFASKDLAFGGYAIAMARMELKMRAWAWVTRRQASVATKSDADVIALQRRHVPDNAVSNWLFGSLPAATAKADRTIPGPDADIPVRVYRPRQPSQNSSQNSSQNPQPLVVYYHGGGFVFGDLRMGDWLCGNVAATVGAVVVSVDYRLAPAHRFPAAVEDCYAALAWAAANAAELGAGGPLGVMGESAGGTLSAVMGLLARERGGPAISHQALIYPATDMTAPRPAALANAPFLSAAEMTAYRRLYLGPDGDRSNPWASPLLAADHAGLPPALIQVAEHDPLREDGVRYAAALRAAGVPVRLTEYVGVPHGFVNFPGLCRTAHQALAEICAEQTAALVPDNEPVP